MGEKTDRQTDRQNNMSKTSIVFDLTRFCDKIKLTMYRPSVFSFAFPS